MQISFAFAMLVGTFWYLADLGVPPVDETNENGVPLKYRIHRPEMFEEVKFKRLVGSKMPSWLMIKELEDHRRKVSAIKAVQEDEQQQKKHLGHLLDEYEEFIFGGSKVHQKSGMELPSMQNYVRDGPSGDDYLETRDFSVLTRSGGKLLPPRIVKEELRIKRMSLAGIQKNIKDLGASVTAEMKDISGSLQKKFNQVVHGAEAVDSELQLNKTITFFEVLHRLIRFAHHVFIRGVTDGINSMLQAWALLILISTLLRAIQIPYVEVVDTALMSLASLSYIVSLAAFYRVNSRLGPFMVLLNTMLATDLVTWLFIVVTPLCIAIAALLLHALGDTHANITCVARHTSHVTGFVSCRHRASFIYHPRFADGFLGCVQMDAWRQQHGQCRRLTVLCPCVHLLTRVDELTPFVLQINVSSLHHRHFCGSFAHSLCCVAQCPRGHVRLHLRQSHGLRARRMAAAARFDHPAARARALLPARPAALSSRLQGASAGAW